MIVEIFVPVTADELEGKLTELPEVVASHSPGVRFVESEWHGGNLAVSRGVFTLQLEHVLLDLGISEGLLYPSSVRS